MIKTLLTISIGAFFGTVLIVTDAFNWYRIQEMFHFDSFHMYGVIGSAIAVGGFATWLLKKLNVLSIEKNQIRTIKKEIQPFGNTIGGLLFGAGWALTGACTAPVFILLGYQWEIGLLALTGAIIGTLLFGITNKQLPK